MAEVFISYARDDSAFAGRLKGGIEAGGFSAWMDTTALSGGESYTQEIESAIQTAACVVVVVSTASNGSEWVRREALYAMQIDKPIVPVFAEQVPLPVLLADRNAVALQDDFTAGLERLLTALRDQTAKTRDPVVSSDTLKHMGRTILAFAAASMAVMVGIIVMRGGGLAAEILATAAAIGGALLAMAWKADDAISPQMRRDLSLWLVQLDPVAVGRSMQKWPIHFAALFDKVFGKKHLSWRCFFRSALASLLAFLLCTLVYMQAAPGEWSEAGRSLLQELSGGASGVLGKLALLTGLAAVLNLLPDYFSLLETRYVIRCMQRSRPILGQISWLVFDFVATAAIFLSFPLAVTLIGSGGSLDSVMSLVLQFTKTAVLAPAGLPEGRFVAIFFWTTYFTTAWVWLYFAAQFLMRLANPLRRTLSALQYALPIEQHPLRAVGQTMAVLAFVGYCAFMLPVSTLAGGAVGVSYLEPEMVVIQPGEFTMGSPVSEVDHLSGEGPQHEVKIAKRFAIGKHEVTFNEYDLFAKATGRALSDDEGGGRGGRPVINVDWDDASSYAQWISKQTGEVYRLPTEAEWEYAARAGTESPFSTGNCIHTDQANYDGDFDYNDCGADTGVYRGETVPSGSLPANPWGLHEVHGNVWEWLEDCWHKNYEGAPVDGTSWLDSDDGDCGLRVLRGGFWGNRPDRLRSAGRNRNNRANRYFFIGFRLAQDL